jgi:hypothetical protein
MPKLTTTLMKTKLTFTAVLLLILVSVGVLFAPLFYIKDIVFAGLGSSAPQSIYFQNYNPLAPTIYWAQENIDTRTNTTTTIITYANLTRNGIWSFTGYNPTELVTEKNLQNQNYNVVTLQNTTKEDALKKAKSQDLTKSTNYFVSGTPQQQIEDRQKQIDEVERLKKLESALPLECNLKDSMRIGTSSILKGFKITEIQNLSNNVENEKLYLSFKFDSEKETLGSEFQDAQKIKYVAIKLSDSQYPKLKLAQLYFGEMIPNREFNPDDKLNKVFLVLQDCTRIEVPAKPDGTFDFESVEGKIK